MMMPDRLINLVTFLLFTARIVQMRETGMMEQWLRTTIRLMSLRMANRRTTRVSIQGNAARLVHLKNDDAKTLTLEDIYSVFITLIFGLTTGVTIFLLEIVYKHFLCKLYSIK